MAYDNCLAITTDKLYYDDEHERSFITALIDDMYPSLL